jgi:hypothetical protein
MQLSPTFFILLLLISHGLPGQNFPPGVPDIEINYSEDYRPSGNGYFILTNHDLDLSNFASIIVDTEGNLLYYSYENVFFDLQHGNVQGIFFDDASGFFTFASTDPFFSTPDTIKPDSLIIDAHDAMQTPEGNIFLLCTDTCFADLSAYHQQNPALTDSMYLLVPLINEYDSTGKLLFSWRADRVFSFEDIDPVIAMTIFSNYVAYMHPNRISLRNGNELIVSFRTASCVVSIDYPSGDVNWVLGGKKNDFTFIGDTVVFSGQHDAHFRENGNLVMLDNGLNNSTNIVRAIEYKLDTANMTAEAIWQYAWDSTMQCIGLGSMGIVDDTNYLVNFNIAEPDYQDDPVLILTPGKEIQMAMYMGAPKVLLYRVRYYPDSFPLYRPQTKYIYDTSRVTLFIDEQADAYYWPGNSSSAELMVSDTGQYYCYADLGFGYVKSLPVYIDSIPVTDTVTSDTTSTTLLQTGQKPKLFPNPGNGTFSIKSQNHAIIKIDIYNIHTKIRTITNVGLRNHFHIDQVPGVYFIRLTFENGTVGYKKYLLVR